jgi:hypothetical protein
VIFTSSYADVTLPLKNIGKINFSTEANSPVEEGQAAQVNVKAYLAGGGSVTLALNSWSAKGIAATSPDFGKAAFMPDAFQRLQLHPGGPAQPDDSATGTEDDTSPENDASIAEKADSSATDTLRFTNKDALHGIFLSCDKAGVHWQSPAAKEPFIFQTSALIEANLNRRKQSENTIPTPAWFVQLANGDLLPGMPVSLDDKKLLLDTWYAGRLAIPRGFVTGITQLQDRKTILYQGSASMDGWVVDRCIDGDDDPKRKDAWVFHDGAFISTGLDVIKRKIQLPARSSIEFDLDMPGSGFSDATPHIEIWLSDEKTGYILDVDNQQSSVPGRMERFSENHFTLRRFSPGNPAKSMTEPAVLPGTGLRREKVHLDLRIDKEAGTIWLFVNGRLARQWVDKDGFAGPATTLMFDTMDSEGSHTSFSHIRLSAWNGKLDAPSTVSTVKPLRDNIVMENGDTLSGSIKNIAGGTVHFDSSYAGVPVPLDHAREITLLPSSTAAAIQPSDGPIHASLAGGGNVTLTLESWDAKHVVASSPCFGNTVFLPRAFLQLQFKIDKPSPPDNSTIDKGDEGDKEQ